MGEVIGFLRNKQEIRDMEGQEAVLQYQGRGE
jgi:hypothetical protein